MAGLNNEFSSGGGYKSIDRRRAAHQREFG